MKRLPFCLAAVLLPALLLHGQQQPPLSYTLLPAEGARPSARFDGTIAYDPAARALYLFGGADAGTLNDLWMYSLAQRRWTEIAVTGAKPPARLGHTMIFDPVRRRLVVFGGQAAGFFSDTWAFDIAQGAWAQLARDEAGPSRRYGHSGVYDARGDRMIVSHGFTDAGRFDDTWAFEFAAGRWRNLSPSTGRPLRRCLHHAVYDEGNQQMLLYGGCASPAGPCPLGDLWSFDLNANRWTERAAGSGAVRPPAREHYGVAFDSVRGRLVLFGGSGGGKLNDTWEFDARGGVWQQPVIEGPPPAARSRHQGVFAPDRGASFFFGGVTASGSATNELWMLGPGIIANTPLISDGGVANAFSGVAGGVAPGQIVSLYGSNLGPLGDGVSLGFDSVTGRLPVSGPGVAVTFNGIPAPLYFVRADQLNVQAPYELQGAGEARIVVTVNGASGPAVVVPVVAAKPGLFPRFFHPDGSAVTPENPALPGGIVILFATGQGITSPPSVTGAAPAGGVFPDPVAETRLRIGGQDAAILFRGQAPGTVGVIQINARVPDGVAGPAAAVVLSIGGAESQPGVALPVR